jgi:excisionase family DNA binding protein
VSEVLTLAEAAERLGIHRVTAYKLVARGAFPVPVLTVGSRMKVSRRALDVFLAGGQNTGEAS